MGYQKPLYLTTKRNVYYYTRRVPKNLQARFQSSRFVKCLHTKSQDKAGRLSIELSSRLENIWDRMRLEVLDFKTPEFLLMINTQEEANIHNIFNFLFPLIYPLVSLLVFFVFFFLEKIKIIIVVTGKGLHSQNEKNPYVSKDLSILKYSVPEFISKNKNLMKIIYEMKDAKIEDGGSGAFYIFLKKNKSIK